MVRGTEWIKWDALYLPPVLDVPYAARPTGNPGGGGKRNVLNLLCAFDVETSKLPNEDQSILYHWQMQLGFETPTVYGRELWEVRAFFDKIAGCLKPGDVLPVYVHNLAYEFHFIRGVFPELHSEDVFSLSPRKPVKVKLYGGRIELRCSYILTNMSLGEWTTKMKVPHAKKDSERYDHRKTRYPWDPMTDEELEYCRNDVLGLIEALQKQLELYDDTLHGIPLTSTGYIRRMVKRCMKEWSYKGLQKVQPSEEVYVALREAFRGGDTHANRYYNGQIISNVKSADRSSSYPDVICNRRFPMGTFTRLKDATARDLDRLVKSGRAVLVRLVFYSLQLKDDYDPAPYISHSKTRGIPAKRCILDNGRIMQAPHAEMTITDIDYKIIKEQYKWDRVIVLDLWQTYYGYLPDILRRLVINLYEDKTRLRGVKEEEVYYNKQKALLNSVYGLMAYDVCKPTIVYNDNLDAEPEYEPDELPSEHDRKKELFYVQEGDISELLAKARRNPATGYQWGVWVCALAREELRRVVKLAGDLFLYCDTDSVKYVGDLDLTAYNAEKIRNSTANGAFASDRFGEVHYMGVFEDDGLYERFVTYGAKKYAYEAYETDKKTGELKLKTHITIAGVSKAKGAEELVAAGGLDALKIDFVFRSAGGTESVYNDRPGGLRIIDGHELYVYPNVCIVDSTYTLSLSDDYSALVFEDLLYDIDTIRRIRHERKIKAALTGGKNKNKGDI